MTHRILGVIGGSGLYAIDGLDARRQETIETPWGEPSGPLVMGRLNGVDLVFLARHGEGHRIPPDAINYRANIDALKRAGATDIVTFSACGSLKEALAPGCFVVVDQFIDRTTTREKSFFGPGLVAHVSMARPVCPALASALVQSCKAVGVPFVDRATYVIIDGPQFSSLAESNLYRSWGCDIIGMTGMPEAKFAREAELPYATLAMVTDYDCWREDEKPVEVADVIEVMRANTMMAQRVLVDLCARLGPTRKPSPLGIETALDVAIMTAPDARDPDMIKKLDAVAGRVLS
ncbi:MAG: S-methyl-5'-thioadenosine phosphorylase [Parvularculaceae bacterium]